MKTIHVNGRYEMVDKMIDLALLLTLPDKYRLLPREKQFLIHTIISSNEGYDLEGSDIVSEICSIMKIKKADVYNYRNILKKKGWLKQTPKGLDLLPFLDFSERDVPRTLKIAYNVIRE